MELREVKEKKGRIGSATDGELTYVEDEDLNSPNHRN